MSQLNIQRAFLTAFVTTNSVFSLPAAYENRDYKPTPGTAYAELLFIPNEEVPLSLKDSNETTGLFRVILRYPVNQGSGNAFAKAQEIVDAFPIGSELSYSGTKLRIMRSQLQRGLVEDGWFKVNVTFRYVALLTR